jgi:hypothetical protein
MTGFLEYYYDMVACVLRKKLSESGAKGAQARSRLAHMTDLLTRYG